MDECYGSAFLKNGQVIEAAAFDDSLVYEGDSVYEVLRVSNGIPLFFTDHISRLKHSVEKQDKSMLATEDIIRKDIKALNSTRLEKEVNLKIVFNYNSGATNYLMYYIKPQYPTEEQYNNGVKGILVNAERKDPSSKVINHRLRSDIFQKLIAENAYEAILVDHRNRITEGSRSNIFFIRNNTIFTAPEGLILSGITRKYIIDICRENAIKVVFECVNADEIGNFEAVFMSGTSPVALPFCIIDKTTFNVKLPLIEEIRRLFRIRAEKSIMDFLSHQ